MSFFKGIVFFGKSFRIKKLYENFYILLQNHSNKHNKMQNGINDFHGSTPFEKYVLKNLSEINKKLKFKNSPYGDYLTPTEVCDIIKISKGKFYQLVKDGFLTTIKLDPKGRKTLVLRSQVENLFPKNFQS